MFDKIQHIAYPAQIGDLMRGRIIKRARHADLEA